MSTFYPNYPTHAGYSVLSTPLRCDAPPEITGRGVVMAFIDSGFYPHPDLEGRILCHVDATSSNIVEGRRFNKAAWYSWHGQMTSVVAAGAGADFPGIASAAKLVLIKVSTARGRIKERDILRGFRWLLANYQRFGVRVVNVSVGGDVESFDPDHPLHHAVEQAVAAGMVVCVAAGNSRHPHLVPPASAPSAITVGGVNDQNTLDPQWRQMYHSNWGTAYDGTRKPELIAPAQWIAAPILPGSRMAREAHWLVQLFGADNMQIRRVLREGYDALNIPRVQALRPTEALYTLLQHRINTDKLIDAEHQHVDGTSVSVAIVSSIVAQLLEVRPNLTPHEVRALLMATAEPLPGIEAERQGCGIIQSARALAVLQG